VSAFESSLSNPFLPLSLRKEICSLFSTILALRSLANLLTSMAIHLSRTWEILFKYLLTEAIWRGYIYCLLHHIFEEICTFVTIVQFTFCTMII